MPRKDTAGHTGSSKPATKKPSVKPSGRKKRTTKREGIRQPHGGMLIPGAGGGPQPGSGRPPSVIRKELLGSFDQRKNFLDRVIDGEAVQHIEVGLRDVLPHVQCKQCGEGSEVVPRKGLAASLIKYDVMASASVKDRVAAVDLQAKYSLGAIKGILADTVKDKVGETLEIIRTTCTAEQYTKIRALLRPVWAGASG